MTKAKLEIRMSEAMDAVSSNARLGDVHNKKKQKGELSIANTSKTMNTGTGVGIPKK